MGRKSRLKKERRLHKEKYESAVVNAYKKSNPVGYYEVSKGIKLPFYKKVLIKLLGGSKWLKE